MFSKVFPKIPLRFSQSFPTIFLHFPFDIFQTLSYDQEVPVYLMVGVLMF